MVMQMRTFIFLLLAMLWPFSSMADAKTTASQAEAELERAEHLQQQKQLLEALRLRVYVAPLLNDVRTYRKNHDEIWRLLKRLSPAEIRLAQTFREEADLQGWLDLLAQVQNGQVGVEQQVMALQQWLDTHTTHPAALIPVEEINTYRQATTKKSRHIAVILPFEGQYSAIAIAIRDGFLGKSLEAGNPPTMTFHTAPEKERFLDVYNKAIKEGADLVIGPLLKNQLEELYALKKLPVPTIALNQIDNPGRPENLLPFSLSPEEEIGAVVGFAIHQHHKTAVIIAQEDSRSAKNIEIFTTRWKESGGILLDSRNYRTIREQPELIKQLLNIDKSEARVLELQQAIGGGFQHQARIRQDIDMIMLFAKPESAVSLQPLLAFYYANNIPIFSTSTIYRGYPSATSDTDLNKIYFTESPLVLSDRELIPEKYRSSALLRMYAFGADAYHLAERISVIHDTSSFTLEGATGTIQLKEGVLIRRPWIARFEKGNARITNTDIPQ